METLIFKLTLTPLLIGIVSLAGRRWGPVVSGWLVGLPLTSGPVVLFLALDQGKSFAAASAQAIMMGIISVGVFCLTYSWLARHWGWLPTVLVGWLMVVLSTWALQQISVGVLPAFIAVVVVLGGVLVLLPRTPGAQAMIRAAGWDIPLRMVVATAFVLTLTGLAQTLGPHLSGLLAPFPIFASILAVFTHRLQGGATASKLLRGVVTGSFSFAGFFLVVAVLLQPAGILITFLCASAVALGVHAISLWLLRRDRAGALSLVNPEG